MNCVPGFAMPMKVTINGQEVVLQPTTEWKLKPTNATNSQLEINPNYYVSVLNSVN
ncbi:MAG: hypothetical protein RL074_351 [Bacteroidota bacterium]